MTSKNIFVACDVSSQKEILNLLELIHEDISGIKIGLQYITQRSPEEIRELSKFDNNRKINLLFPQEYFCQV